MDQQKNLNEEKSNKKKIRMKYTQIFSLSDEKLDGVLLKVCRKKYKNWTGIEFEKRFRGPRKEWNS